MNPIRMYLEPYQLSLFIMSFVVVLFIVQNFVALAARYRNKQIPGLVIEGGHDVFLFRADRARSNLLEVLGPFVLAWLIGILLAASSTMITFAVSFFVAGRYLHTVSYYAKWELPRRFGFMMGNVATMITLVAIFRTL